MSVSCLLKICDDYSKEFNVHFNLDKYQLLHCTKSANHLSSINYNGIEIKASKMAKHLGIYITNDLLSDENINKACMDLSVRVSSVLTLFPNAHCNVRYTLFQQFCMSLYGCPMWDLTTRSISKLYTLWRKAIRKIWKVPYDTHCRFLHVICDSLPIELQLAKRFVKFMYQTMSNNNQVSTLCGRLALAGSMSPVGNNFSLMSHLLKCNRYKIPERDTVSFIYDCQNNKCINTDQTICSVISDCITMRDERSTMFSSNELTYFIDKLCKE